MGSLPQVLCYMIHPTLVRKTLIMFHCINLPDEYFSASGRGVDGGVTATSVREDHWVLGADSGLSCADPNTVRWMVMLGLPMLVAYVLGLPLVLMAVLRRIHARNVTPTQAEVEQYGFLFSECTCHLTVWCQLSHG